MIEGLRSRFDWLDEYFVWKETSVEFRCSVPRLALRFTQQTSWFLDRLLGHVLMVREGPFVERITQGGRRHRGLDRRDRPEAGEHRRACVDTAVGGRFVMSTGQIQ